MMNVADILIVALNKGQPTQSRRGPSTVSHRLKPTVQLPHPTPDPSRPTARSLRPPAAVSPTRDQQYLCLLRQPAPFVHVSLHARHLGLGHTQQWPLRPACEPRHSRAEHHAARVSDEHDIGLGKHQPCRLSVQQRLSRLWFVWDCWPRWQRRDDRTPDQTRETSHPVPVRKDPETDPQTRPRRTRRLVV